LPESFLNIFYKVTIISTVLRKIFSETAIKNKLINTNKLIFKLTLVFYFKSMKKIITLFSTLLFAGCQSSAQNKTIIKKENTMQANEQIATFAGGCFWCTEAVFLEIDGVQSVTSGYIGGTVINPTYKEVCNGTTGHAEAIQIVFDTNKVSFEVLLELFFATHDPTTLNRQGNDIGTQYRSEVFYHNQQQKETTENYIIQLQKEHTYGFGTTVVTKVSPATTFYPAEDYHQNYYNQNKDQGYCHYVITPKVEKVKKSFKKYLKTNN
jgi:peptide-methionine (S)-S-oxide reductase